MCLICGRGIRWELTLREIIGRDPLLKPVTCVTCHRKFDPLVFGSDRCQTCWQPSPTPNCSECQDWSRRYQGDVLRHQALFRYNEAFSEWLTRYKFLGDYRYRLVFQRELFRYFKQPQVATKTLVTIPLAVEKFKQRGFNQVEGLLASIGVTSVPLLQKREESAAQVAKNRSERLATPQPFSVNPRLQSRSKKASILLVDDVYTTGRTLYHARDCLREMGYHEITSFSLAR